MKKKLLALSILILCFVQLKSKTNFPIKVKLAPPTADFTVSAEKVCVEEVVEFTDISPGSPNKWQWLFPGGTPSTSTEQNPSVKYGSPGTYTVTLTVEGPEGIATVTKNDIITVNPFPVSTFSFSGNECQVGNSFNFTNTGSVGTHSWTFSGGSPASSTLPNPSGVTFVTLGSHAISHTVTDNGCKTTTTGTITIFPLTTSISVPSAFANCSTGAGSFTITTSGGTAPFSYSVNGVSTGSTIVYTNKIPGSYSITVKDSHGCVLNGGAVTVHPPSPPTGIVISVTNTACNVNGGKISLGNVTGGTPSYSFSFDNGALTTNTLFTNLFAGFHDVVVKDANGCTFTTTAKIFNTNGPTDVVLNVTNAICNPTNGAVSIGSVTGGTSPFKYQIDGLGFSDATTYPGLSSGSHNIEVRDNAGCIFPKSVSIINIQPTAVVTSVTNTPCGLSVGAVSLGTVTGGQPSYSFSFNGSTFSTTPTTFTGLGANTYQVRVMDSNNCIFEKNVIVANPSGPNNIEVAITNETCNGDNGLISVIAVTGGTGGPLKYDFDHRGFVGTTTYSNIPSDTYPLSVLEVNTGCIFNRTVSISNIEPTGIDISIVSPACNTNTGSVTVGNVIGGKPTYSLSFNNGPFITNIPATFSGLPANIYPITIKDGNNCTFTTVAIVNNSSGPTNVVTTSTNAICGASNGIINIGSVTGASSPFSFKVDGSAFSTTVVNYPNLAAGDHTLTIKDNIGCILQRIVPITNIQPNEIVFTVTNTPCNLALGKIRVTNAIGGLPGYSLSFNNGAFNTFTSATTFTGLAVGSYTLKVKDANNCVFTQTVDVKNIDGPNDMNIIFQDDLCGGGNGFITINSVTGGTPTLNYSIDGINFIGGNSFLGLSAGNYTVTVRDGAGCKLIRMTTLINVPGPSDFLFTTTGADCNLSNGIVTFSTVIGGTPNYQFFVDNVSFGAAPTFTGLAVGTHTLIVRDNNGCTVSKIAAITFSNAISNFNLSSVKAGCTSTNDGIIFINSNINGLPPFLFSINGGTFGVQQIFRNQPAGIYTLVVKDANNCTSTKTVAVVGVPLGPTSITASIITTPGCALSNGVVNALHVGGNAPFTFGVNATGIHLTSQSSNTFTGLEATNYFIVVKDVNGCSKGSFFVLSTVGSPSVINIHSANSTCDQANGSFTVNSVVGGPPTYSYSFNGGAFVTSTVFTGIVGASSSNSIPDYNFIVKDANNCTFKGLVHISNSNITIPTPTITRSFFDNHKLISSSANGNQWFRNSALISGATGQTLTTILNGTYTVKVTIGSCATVESLPFVITNLAGRAANPDTEENDNINVISSNESSTFNSVKGLVEKEEIIDPLSLNVFPNPNDGEFTISFNSIHKTSYKLEILDVLGQVVFKDELIDLKGLYTNEIQLSEFAKGIYTLRLSNSKNNIVKKVVTH